MSKPKPCPFCGTTESIQIDTDTNTCTGTIMHWYATVQCNECEQSEVVLTGDTEEEAIANAISAWNTRHIEDELRAAMDAAKAENARLQKMVDWLAETNATTCELFLPTNFRSDPEIWKESARQAVTAVEGEENE